MGGLLSRAMAQRRDGQPPSETESLVSDEDWYGEDLSGHSASRVAYNRIDLTETRSSSGMVFTECTLRDVRFNAAAHRDAVFLN